MKLTKYQLNLLIENYLNEQEDASASEEEEFAELEAETADVTTSDTPPKEADDVPSTEEETENPIPEKVEFRVATSESSSITIKLVRESDSSLHKVYIDDRAADDLDLGLELNILAAHGFINSENDDQTKQVLKMILSRDSDFAGLSDSGTLGMIARKMEIPGKQSYSLDALLGIVGTG